MSNTTLIYVAGKVTGLPYNQVEAKFKHACNYVKSLGYQPINPLDYVQNKNANWEEAKPNLLPVIEKCDGVYLISDWNDSDGAKEELVLFIQQKKLIITK